jgi:hypothetical protein
MTYHTISPWAFTIILSIGHDGKFEIWLLCMVELKLLVVIVSVGVFVSAEGFALRCKLQSLCAGHIDIVLIVGGLVGAVAAGRLVVYPVSKNQDMVARKAHRWLPLCLGIFINGSRRFRIFRLSQDTGCRSIGEKGSHLQRGPCQIYILETWKNRHPRWLTCLMLHVLQQTGDLGHRLSGTGWVDRC